MQINSTITQISKNNSVNVILNPFLHFTFTISTDTILVERRCAVLDKTYFVSFELKDNSKLEPLLQSMNKISTSNPVYFFGTNYVIESSLDCKSVLDKLCKCINKDDFLSVCEINEFLFHRGTF